ncbi:MAG: nucleotide exchange factor GrpE [Bacteroidales bacterium]|nr:nucleotide exchange factor GrpE [Bacteroidales bacterium]
MDKDENKNIEAPEEASVREEASQEGVAADAAEGSSEGRRNRRRGCRNGGAGEKIASLEAALAKEKDDYLRLMADFDNFRRKSAKDRLELISTASEDVIKGLLPIVDDFERALKALGESSGSEAAVEGIQLIYNKLMDYLRAEGLSPIEAVGKDFDTDLHEAVTQFPVEDEALKGKVYDVVQTGYVLKGKVIRFAKVVVGV